MQNFVSLSNTYELPNRSPYWVQGWSREDEIPWPHQNGRKKALSLVRLQVDVEPMPRILGIRQEYTLDETPVFYRTPWTHIFIHMGNLV